MGFSVFLAVGTAAAQTDLERATARDAANNGRAAYDSGKYEKAIDYLSRAESLVHSPTHLLFMARAQAKLGRLVAAHETYLKIIRESLPPNAPKAFVSAQDAAEQEQDTLSTRLPSITVQLKGVQASDVTVQMDGTNLPPAMVGIPLPADPGEHTFKASGPTVDADPVTVKVAEAAKQTVTLTLRSNGKKPVLAAKPAAATAPAADAPKPGEKATIDLNNAGTPPPGTATAGSSGSGSGLRVASYIALGVGAVGVGVGSYFLLKSRGTTDDADALYKLCQKESGSPVCSIPTRRDEYEAKDADAASQRNIGVGALIGGGVGLVAGVTMLIVGSSSSDSARNDAPRVVPMIGLGSLGIAGKF